jgi:type I site-specific restriction endonuclease
MDRSAAQKGIIDLVTRFENHFDSYKDPNYKETRLRGEFINPFFENLGWDVYNRNNYAEAYREVIQEDTLKIEETLKAPDYSFRLSGGKRLFFVEAKKPSVSVIESIQPAYQVRRYGWSAKHPISVVM